MEVCALDGRAGILCRWRKLEEGHRQGHMQHVKTGTRRVVYIATTSVLVLTFGLIFGLVFSPSPYPAPFPMF